jgi:hypothetical protein
MSRAVGADGDPHRGDDVFRAPRCDVQPRGRGGQRDHSDVGVTGAHILDRLSNRQDLEDDFADGMFVSRVSGR